MAKTSTDNYRGAGRPTQEQSLQRQQALLKKALDMFLKKGYTQTTLDDIAAAMRMTKRTIYSAYDGKEGLFKAAVGRAIEINRVPLEALQALESDDLETTLRKVAHLRVETLLSPDGVRLQRIVNAESYRFPELLQMVYRDSTGPTIEFLTRILAKHAAIGHRATQAVGAIAWMTLVTGLLQYIISGNSITQVAIAVDGWRHVGE